jgi:hypothetical protein
MAMVPIAKTTSLARLLQSTSIRAASISRSWLLAHRLAIVAVIALVVKVPGSGRELEK